MQTLLAVYQWLSGPQGALMLAVLLGISESLALIPQVKANSIFEAIYNGLVFIKNKLLPPAQS